MPVVTRNRERSVIEFDPPFLGGIVHLGKLNYPGARSALRSHRHRDTLEITCVHRGNFVFQTGKRIAHLRGGDVHISFPGEVHGSGEYPEDKAILYWIGIKTENLTENFLHLAAPFEGEALLEGLRALHRRQFRGNDTLTRLIDDAVELYFSDNRCRNILIRNRVSDFIALIIELERKGCDDSVSDLIQDCVTYIEAHIEDRLELLRLSEQCGLSLPRFKQRFKKETGVPPGEFILRRKIALAEEFLKSADNNITAIALDLGFSTSQYFAVVFRRYTGMSPSEYRKRNAPTG